VDMGNANGRDESESVLPREGVYKSNNESEKSIESKPPSPTPDLLPLLFPQRFS